ncbi:MAG: hypothetical protein R3C14_20600 [Caldilineaceae bacterium]
MTIYRLIWLSVGLSWLAVLGGLQLRARRRTGAPFFPFTGLAADLWAGGLLFLLTIGFFWRTLSGDVYQPADGGDLVSFLFPTYRFAAEQLRQWTLPLWNPHLYGGAPFISDIQAGFLYLPNLLLFMLWPDFPYTALQWLAIGHLYWAGLGVYVLLRALEWQPGLPCSRTAALFGAVAFQFSDPLLVHLGNLNLIAVLSWLPWILAAYQQALHRRSLRWTGAAAALFALSTYAGHAQSTFYVLLAVALYTVGWLWSRQGRFPSQQGLHPVKRRSWLAWLPYPILFYAVGALLTAPILLPAVELVNYTERSHFTYQDTVAFSLAPTQLIGLITPGFFGRGPGLYWSLWARVETPYAGIVALILAIVAVLLAEREARRVILPWLGLALFGFATALGIYAVPHGWLTALLPVFGQFRAPARALVLWTLGVAVLAASGVDLLPRAIRMGDPLATIHKLLRTGVLIFFGAVIPLTYIALLLAQANETVFLRTSLAALALTLAAFLWLGAWAIIAAAQQEWIGATTLAGLLVALLFFDLSATGAYTDISDSDPTAGFQHPAIVALLRNDADLMRIDTRTDIAGLWQPDAAALYGLQDVGGVANPLLVRHWQEFWEALGGRQSRLYDMLNVKYVIVPDGVPLPSDKFGRDKFELALDAPGALSVYRNRNFMPRAWLVHTVQSAATLDETLAILQAATFDPTQLAVIPPDTPFTLPLGSTGADDQVTITHYGSSGMTLHVETSVPSLLVLSEVWYPGWEATVNGVSTPVLRADWALRGITVPAGVSTVHLYFAPASWQLGLVALGIGIIALLGLTVVNVVK